MKNLILASIVFSFFMIACNGNKEPKVNREADSLALINKDLNKQISERDSTNKAFMNAFNEVQDNLDSIKMKEKMIIESSRSEDVASAKEQIKSGIQSIYEFMARNRGAIASLSAKLRAAQKGKMEADSTIAEMQKMIERLTAQVDSKDKEISDLKSQLDKLKIDFDALTSNFKAKEEESNQKTTELNTAYYKIATTQELVDKGIIIKVGGFIGLGKAKKLKSDFNKGDFTKIDITQTTSFPLNCKDAKVATSHPQSSYNIEREEKTQKPTKLTITNAKEFWSTSKYLVVETK